MVLKIEDYRYDAENCTSCANCRWIDLTYVAGVDFCTRCPCATYYSFDAWGAYGKMKLVSALLDGELEFSPKLVDVVYQCQMCGSCDSGCKRNLDLEIGLVLETLRAECVNRGVGPPKELKKVVKNIERSHNRYGASHEKRFKWVPDEVDVSEKAEVAYFVGCSVYSHPEIAQSTVKILNAAKTDFMLMPDQWCCGYPLYSMGQWDAFEKEVKHNLEIIKESGARRVVLSCAEGYKTLKVDYPKILGISTSDLGFEVVHFVEYVDELLQANKLVLENSIDKKITYHDPCNLGRLSEPWVHWDGVRGDWGYLTPSKEFRRGINGVYEAPRNILKGIPKIELVEMNRNRDLAWCCGAGGGVKDAYKDFALWTGSERIREAESTGAEAIVSCCPYCKENLSEANNARGGKLEVYDISELILKAISK
jgi:Fe-S oxidoreductase